MDCQDDVAEVDDVADVVVMSSPGFLYLNCKSNRSGGAVLVAQASACVLLNFKSQNHTG
jgi:hypothetical protein